MRDKNQSITHLHMEPVGGIAGDMFLAALLDMGVSPRPIEEAFASLNLPGLSLETQQVSVNNIPSLYVRSMAPESQHHTDLNDVLARIEASSASVDAKSLATKIFKVLANAEARVHGGEAEKVHLHEVGALDSIMDVLGAAIAYCELGAPEMTYAPIPVGCGQVETSHGLLDVPVPAVREICQEHGLALEDVDVQGETLTPTGVALIGALGAKNTSAPQKELLASGVGAGTLRFPQRANVLKVFGYGDA